MTKVQNYSASLMPPFGKTTMDIIPGDIIRAENEVRTVQIIGNEICAVRDGYYCTLKEYLDFAESCGVIVERVPNNRFAGDSQTRA